jgi:hypothetical protein
MKNRIIIPVILTLLLAGLISRGQNVGITDKPGGITPASQLQVHKEKPGTTTLIQMTNQSTGATATDGVALGIDDADNAFLTNHESGKSVYIGTSSGNTEFEADGTLRFNGNATVWEDLQIPASSAGAQGGNMPDWAAFRGSTLKTWAFADQNSSTNEDELYFTIQLPHSWKEGSPVEPHIHISPENAPGSAREVVWKLEYVWANYSETYPAVTNTLTATSIISPADDHRHLIASFGNIVPDGTNDKISSVILCRLSRNSGDASDTYTGRVFLISLDIQFEKDTEGSRVRNSKN